MPLPAALQAKLLQRGLLKQNTSVHKPKLENEEEEEVIAESYDEEHTSTALRVGGQEVDKKTEKVSNCPNRSNPHHTCGNYCIQKFGYKTFDPHPIMEKRRKRMLKIYPLPSGWQEVPDVESNRYYYWNTETNQVCWLSPSHPKARLEHPKKNAETSSSKLVNNKKKDDASDNSHQPIVHKRDDSGKGRQNKQTKSKQDIDPMDPASYSDTCPRGKWSAGLEKDAAN